MFLKLHATCCLSREQKACKRETGGSFDIQIPEEQADLRSPGKEKRFCSLS
jgi:hypothetical protein